MTNLLSHKYFNFYGIRIHIRPPCIHMMLMWNLDRETLPPSGTSPGSRSCPGSWGGRANPRGSGWSRGRGRCPSCSCRLTATAFTVGERGEEAIKKQLFHCFFNSLGFFVLITCAAVFQLDPGPCNHWLVIYYGHSTYVAMFL